jgi:ATP-binding cassette subfamily B protein
MKLKELPKAGIADILRALWRGMKPEQWAAYVSVAVFVASNVFQLITPLYYKSFFDQLTATDRAQAVPGLIHVLIIILVLNAIGWLLSRIGIFIINRFEANTMARLRQQSFAYLIDHSYSFFTDNFSGALVQRVNRFARSFEQLYDALIFNVFPLAVSIIGMVIVVWYQQPFIAMAMLTWVVITMASDYLFSIWKLKYDLRASAADTATTAQLADSISNQTTIAAFAGSARESDTFREVSGKQAAASTLSWQLSSIFDGVQAALIVAIEFFLFYYGVRFWEQGVITIGTFVLIQVYLLGLANELWGFSRVVRTIYQAFADSAEMVSILEMPHAVRDILDAGSLTVTHGKIQFNEVSFAFGSRPPVLKDINLTIQGGQKVALIGPSGAGKSTFVRLILRLYNLEQGVIMIDGQDIQKIAQASLRKAISLVPQDPVLFHRSLLENIRYGRPEATDDEVKAAARSAHCDEFIEKLSDGYNTLVGERGVKLSGGERQRVAIARAILKDAPILILDEATSSLDSHSESLIQDALEKLMRGKTSIVIAHRLSTIRKMDRIIVIQHGRVVEDGTHEELISHEESLYKHLWNLQAGGFIVK